MQYRFIIPGALHSRSLKYLFPESGEEGLVFYLAGKSSGQRWFTLTARELLIPSEDDFAHQGNHGIELNDEAKVRFILRARTENLCLIEAHSHPFVRSRVTLSGYDWENARQFVPYVHLKLKGRPYTTLVFGQGCVDGFIWLPGVPEPIALGEILIVGPRSNKVYPTSSNSGGLDSDIDLERFDRQLRAFGRVGQAQLQKLRVGVVGAGGIGSLVAQSLVYLGVRTFTLIDDDKVEPTNLNRLVGANPWDISTPKVAILGRLIQAVRPTATVHPLLCSVRDAKATLALKDVDIIFGCTDTDSSRLILNDLATSCGIPYIDIATGIESSDGKVYEAGGRVVVVLPEFPCLLCSHEIDMKEAHDELTSPEELGFRKSHGYASEPIQAPSVISLNGVVSSLAVTEFLGMTTGVKETAPCLYYYALKNTLRIRQSRKDSNCLACVNMGKGDHVDIERYARYHLPGDLPK